MSVRGARVSALTLTDQLCTLDQFDTFDDQHTR